MTGHELLSLSGQALALMNQHEFGQAVRHWERLLELQPDWEHGTGAYNLATCYEDLKRFEDADRLYREALRQEPENSAFLGGYGSFLYLHGSAQTAFDIYVKLFRQAQRRGDRDNEKVLLAPLLALGERIGLPEAVVRQRLA